MNISKIIENIVNSLYESPESTTGIYLNNIERKDIKILLAYISYLERLNEIEHIGQIKGSEKMGHNFEELKKLIEGWATDRGIIQNSTAAMQTLKAVSEMGELADAVAKNQDAELKDAVGDVIVCLVNLCAIKKIDIVECLNLAYTEIKDRKGFLTPDGVFVKENLGAFIKKSIGV